MTASRECIRLYVKQLKLPSLVNCEDLLRQAAEDGWSYDRFLCETLLREINRRAENQHKQRLRAARFPLAKSLDTFNFANLPHLEEALVWQLASGEFIDRRENVIMIGNPGTGDYAKCLLM